MVWFVKKAFTKSDDQENKIVERKLRIRDITQQTFVGLQDVKTSSRRLEDISWTRLQDVSEANKIFTGDTCI